MYPDLIGSREASSNTIYGKKSLETLSPNSLDLQNHFNFNTSYLSWSHYLLLIRINDSKARSWYEKEALEQTWSFRTLRRNIQTQYYERMLLSHNDENVENEMKSQINNESEARVYSFFCRQLLVDVDEENDITCAYEINNKEFPFGYAFVRKDTLREINFGDSGAELSGNRAGYDHIIKVFALRCVIKSPEAGVYYMLR